MTLVGLISLFYSMPSLFIINFNVTHRPNFKSCLNIPNRVTDLTKSCIDHIFTNINNCEMLAFTYYSTITNHYPTFLTIKLDSVKSAKEAVSTKLVKIVNFKNLQTDIESEGWGRVYNSKNPDDAAKALTDILNTYINLHTTVIKSNRNRKIKPWITVGLITSMRRRDRLNFVRKQNPNDQHLADYYRRYRNLVTLLTKQIKNQYYEEKINSAGSKLNKVWRLISVTFQISRRITIKFARGKNREKNAYQLKGQGYYETESMTCKILIGHLNFIF